jgi:quercetin dioxygenase-like cupin family protein
MPAMNSVGRLSEAVVDNGVYDDHADGLARQPLVDRAAGSPHQALTHFELAPGGRIERHVHAFEEAFYVLEGTLEVEVAGHREELQAHDYVWIEVGVGHELANRGSEPARWLEVSAPAPGSSLEDTVFSGTAGAQPDSPYRRGHFDVSQLPPPGDNILAGTATNVGGASVRLLVDREFGASALVLMALRYAPGGSIKEHDHAFEEAFFFLEGEIEVLLDGETLTLGPGDYFWSGVGSTHALTNVSDKPVLWLETQAPQPPSRHQFRFRADWERLYHG